MAAVARAMAAASASVGAGHVVERPVGLDVLESHALGAGDGRQGADLVDHEVLDLARGAPQVATTEAGQVGKPGMRTDGNAMRPGERHRLPHHPRVARVEATGDVGR